MGGGGVKVTSSLVAAYLRRCSLLPAVHLQAQTVQPELHGLDVTACVRLHGATATQVVYRVLTARAQNMLPVW